MSYAILEPIITETLLSGDISDQTLSELQKFQKLELTGAEGSKLNDALELLPEQIESMSNKNLLKFILTLASLNPPGKNIRFGLAKIISCAFTKLGFSDTFVAALDIDNKSNTPATIAEKVEMLLRLFASQLESTFQIGEAIDANKYCCFHKTNGFGEFIEFDKDAEKFIVKYRSQAAIPAEKFIADTAIIIPGGKTQGLIGGGKINTKSIYASELKEDLAKEFFPKINISNGLLARLLMPASLKSIKAFETWSNRKAPVKADNSDASNSGDNKWRKARSIDELKAFTEGLTTITVEESDYERLLKAFKFAVGKDSKQEAVSDTLCHLWGISTDKEILIKLVQELQPLTLAWKEFSQFSALLHKMKTIQAGQWVQLSAHACGIEFFSTNCLSLPRKQWDTISTTFGEEGTEALYQGLLKVIKTGEISSDALLWVWSRFENDKDKLNEVFHSPALIFRAINRGDAGSALRSSKDLKILFMKDDTFFDYMAGHGDEAAVANLISAIRSMPGLQTGERGVLLVRLVRLYPELKHLVESSNPKTTTKMAFNYPRISSVASYRTYEAEFKDIVNKQIPENSESIKIALEHGDLRENSEFKYAKERQKFLQSRETELKDLLAEVKPSDFSEFEFAGRANPGCEITLNCEGEALTYTILGLWDSQPERNFVSFETQLAKALLGKGEGDAVTLPNGKGAKIDKIAPISDKLRAELS